MQGERVALVTGGGGGIGRAVAQSLVEQGLRVAIVDRERVAAARVGAELGVHVIEADLADGAACRRVIAEVVSVHGAIHVLVNNAGFQHVAPIQDFPEEVWQRMLAVMLTAPFLLTRYAWPHMVAAGWGRVVNISSIHGKVASPYKVGYVSAKHGLLGLTRTAALEGGDRGITVNAICPAYVRTPLVEDQIAAQASTRNISPERVVEEVMLQPAAVKRLIEPEEVGRLVAYLCSEEAGAITGAAWDMDLGWTAR